MQHFTIQNLHLQINFYYFIYVRITIILAEEIVVALLAVPLLAARLLRVLPHHPLPVLPVVPHLVVLRV